MAFQDCAIHWARDHRVHHKYSETDADPHNATRYVFNWINNRIGPCFVTFVNFHCPRLSISPVDSFSLTLAGCCAKNIPRLKQRAKESIYPTSKMIQYCVSKRSKSHRSNEWLKTGGDPWIFTVKCTILDIWMSDNVIIACTFIVLTTIWMQLSHNNIIYLIFFSVTIRYWCQSHVSFCQRLFPFTVGARHWRMPGL